VTPEHQRLEQARTGAAAWKAWGPYLSERQWGTVREDDSSSGDAWNAFTHDEARSKAYRWGEDGLAGVSDDQQRLCLALALWNGNDPILKERIFGLTNSEGNHGEDAKEYWFYVDSTPTHSYMKWAYKYPQAAFPYAQLVAENASRGRDDYEYELLDTGVFDEDRYFDVEVEYAKGGPEDLLMLVTVHNRGPDAATVHVLPTLWFRNTWRDGSEKPALRIDGDGVAADGFRFTADGALKFCENESDGPYPKVTINDHVLHGAPTNPARTGTKCAAHSVLEVPAGGSATVRARLSTSEQGAFDAVLAARREEADAFYATVIPEGSSEDRARIMRQSLAGMLWTKQYYGYDVHEWLRERGINPWSAEAAAHRNGTWFHLAAGDIISMPDKWEYPWFAAWDLAFHCAPLALVDVDFAKEQVELLLHTRYVHPNGQIPAYEWNFSDVNPPVTAWAALWVYQREALLRGSGDRVWLGRVFQRLLTNFTWWVNRKDPDGRNLFQGGFLGLDNIGIFDRSSPLPGGGTLQQADGTAWMALYCQWMLQIAVELGREDQSYADIALKFVAHFAWIAIALNPPGADTPLWDEADGFFYDVMRMPDGTTVPLRVRSLVGLLPMCAATVFDLEDLASQPELVTRALHFAERFQDSVPALAHVPSAGHEGRRMLALVDHHQLEQILKVMLDEDEFLSPHGIRSISRRHLDDPCEFDWAGQHYEVRYQPAESDSAMFGGNSNWRGPVWFPMNLVILRALFQLHRYYGEDFTVECPTGSGQMMNLREVALEISRRLISTFERGADGKRPVYGGLERFQDDPHWRDLLLFYEYFHGDNGAGLGASHQTGWTGTVATLLWLVS
jgi:hypothetical protein